MACRIPSSQIAAFVLIATAALAPQIQAFEVHFGVERPVDSRERVFGVLRYTTEAPAGIRNRSKLRQDPKENHGIDLSFGSPRYFTEPSIEYDFVVSNSLGPRGLRTGEDVFLIQARRSGTSKEEGMASPIVFQVLLRDASGIALATAGLPDDLEVEDLDTQSIDTPGTLRTVQPDFRNLSVRAIPEPATGLLLGLGLIGLACERRR